MSEGDASLVTEVDEATRASDGKGNRPGATAFGSGVLEDDSKGGEGVLGPLIWSAHGLGAV